MLSLINKIKSQIKKNLTSDLGNIFVEMSLPSIQHLSFFFTKSSWNFLRIFLILAFFAISAETWEIFWVCKFMSSNFL